MDTSRRSFLTGSIAVLVTALTGCSPASQPEPRGSVPSAPSVPPSAGSDGKVVLTDEQWRARLTDEQYAVLRQSATEMPFTSPLLEEHRAGKFACAGCDLDLFSSGTKYDSGTGWPSFWDAVPGAVGTAEDTSEGMLRTSLHCARCEGHLGHVFTDGPPPTGLRYCIDGVALVFKPA